MRVLGMISGLFVIVAVVLGVYSLVDGFGFMTGEIFGILWPVALGVVALSLLLLVLGRWSAKMLLLRDNQGKDQSEEPR